MAARIILLLLTTVAIFAEVKSLLSETLATQGEFPSIAIIHVSEDEVTIGVLVTPHRILTAWTVIQFHDYRRMRVQLGCLTVENCETPLLRPTHCIPNPAYSTLMIVLRSSVVSSPTVKPAPIGSSIGYSGRNCTFVAFHSEDDQALASIDVQILERNLCRSVLGVNIPEKQACFDDSSVPSSITEDDYGGPILCDGTVIGIMIDYHMTGRTPRVPQRMSNFTMFDQLPDPGSLLYQAAVRR
ncbi:mast cell protease 8-like [Fopius arisanus]|uniref:Mast cell protease 8-like n=1 Tax=Fopius arisanus TaxID=64838 RepID=A0A9R1T5V5_9HYME|nr:PREDICTED: mast cell protease 8-like [Fopius arisanus]